jgi:hypothetical protein
VESLELGNNANKLLNFAMNRLSGGIVTYEIEAWQGHNLSRQNNSQFSPDVAILDANYAHDVHRSISIENMMFGLCSHYT